MDLYDIGARGFSGPLNAREISQLFRAGLLHPRIPCKPKGDATWRTIDELFPLLKYEAAAPRLHFDQESGAGGRVFVRSAKLVLCLLGALAALHFHARPVPNSSSGKTPAEITRVVAPVRQAENPSSSAIAFRDRPPVR